jgi:hypothetical protein
VANKNLTDLIRKAQKVVEESRAIRAKVEQTRNKVMQSTNRHAQLTAQLRKRSAPNQDGTRKLKQTGCPEGGF